MRLNRFVAQASGMSRRDADEAITAGRVSVGKNRGKLGQAIEETRDQVYLDHRLLTLQAYTTILFNKPVGFVVSRAGQGSKTVYDLLPPEFHHLKPIGRLDKDSSGLLLLTNDGKLAAELTHPRHEKEKIYEVELNRPLSELHHIASAKGVNLEDGLSKLKIDVTSGKSVIVTLSEGRNRQIRRTFAKLGYNVIRLHRTHFGPYCVDDIDFGKYKLL